MKIKLLVPFAGVGLIIAVAALWYARSSAVPSEQDEAVAFVLSIIEKPEKLSATRPSGVERGPKDRKVDYWNAQKEDPNLTSEELADVRELATAIIKGDLARVQRLVDRYEGKPYGLCVVNWHVWHAFAEAGLPFDLTGHRAFLHLEQNRGDQVFGNLSLMFQVGKPPRVQITVPVEGGNDRTWQTKDVTDVSAEVVMKTFGLECTRAALFTKNGGR